jgi:hypothetical protein
MADEKNPYPKESGAPDAKPKAPPPATGAGRGGQGGGISPSNSGGPGHEIGPEVRSAVRRELRLPEWIMAIFTALIFVAAILSFFVSQGQLKAMRGQLDEMKAASGETHNLVLATQNLASAGARQATATELLKGAAQSQATAAGSQATAMDKLRTAGEAQAKASQALADAGRSQAASTASLANATGRQLAAIQAQADAARTQAQAVSRQADATVTASKATDRLAGAGQAQSQAVLQSLDTAREANRIAAAASALADRPWASFSMPGNIVPEAGKEYTVASILTNTGRSPALRVYAAVNIGIFPVKIAVLPDLPKCDLDCRESTVFPSAAFSYSVKIPKEIMTADELARITAPQDAIVMRTRIDYTDSYGKSHASVSCYFYLNNLGFTSCATGNDAN